MHSAIAINDWQATVEALYREDADRLYRALFAYAADREVATEAVAEAYAQALRRGSVIRDPAAWVWRAAFKIAAGNLKVRRTTEPLDELPVAIDWYDDRHADPDLVAALRQLPEGQRAAVILFYYADLPVRAIAARLGTSQLAVRANLHRGRQRLRGLLGGDDD